LRNITPRASIRSPYTSLFRSQHLEVSVLALRVGPAHESKRSPLVGRQLTALELLERLDELVDLGLVRERQLRPAQRLRIVDGCQDRKSTRLNSSHVAISYDAF